MPKGRLLLPVALFCSLATVAFALGSDWPRFRGPNGTGIADARTIPVEWTAKDMQWKIPLPGPGNGSPVVWKGRIFLQSTSKDGNQRSLLCYDAKDGSLKWSDTFLGKQYKKLHKLNTMASQTPAVDADHVYVAFWDGDKVSLYGYTHEGKQLWNRDLGTFTSQHGAVPHRFPTAAMSISMTTRTARPSCFASKAKRAESFGRWNALSSGLATHRLFSGPCLTAAPPS